MKIKINKRSLIKCLDTVSMAIPKKPLLPITNNLLFKITEKVCCIYAYNQEFQIKGQFSVDFDESIEMCIPASTLMNTIKLLPDEEIGFNYNSEKYILNITAGRRKYKITGYNPKDFPVQTPSIDDQINFKVPTIHIINHIRTLSKIIDWSEMRESLSGLTMIVNHGKLEITGVHGPRYFYRGITSITPEEEFNIVIPRGITMALALAQGKGDAEMIIGKRNIAITMDGFEYISVLKDVPKPLIVENYFDYDREKYIVIDKIEFLNAMRRLTIYSNDDACLVLSLEGKELKLKSENVNFNIDAEEVMDVANHDVDDRVFGMNINYMISMIGNLKGDKFKILNGTGKIRMICIQDYENENDSEMWGCGEYVLSTNTVPA